MCPPRISQVYQKALLEKGVPPLKFVAYPGTGKAMSICPYSAKNVLDGLLFGQI